MISRSRSIDVHFHQCKLCLFVNKKKHDVRKNKETQERRTEAHVNRERVKIKEDWGMEHKLKSLVSSIRGPFLRKKPDDSGSTDNDKPEELDQPGRGEAGNRSLK